MPVPDHHKSLAKHLREKFGEPATVAVYRDNQGKRPIPIGAFGPGKSRFYSTIGLCDDSLDLPPGHYELAALGVVPWLPNALATSIYWLKGRATNQWPLVCEDVVKQNAHSTYRHMVYVPSAHTFQPPSGPRVTWLLGVPIRDSEITLSLEETIKKIRALYPAWLHQPTSLTDPHLPLGENPE